MGSLGTAGEYIQNAWKQLSRQWQTTASLWRDASQRQFAKEYVEEYEPVISAALKALDHLDQVIAQAEKNVK